MAVSSDKLGSNIAVYVYDHDPDDSGAQDVEWKDMRDFNSFMAIFFHSVGTGTISEFDLLGNAQSAGTGTDLTLKSHALGSNPDAVGDYLFLEVTASEIAQLDTSTITGDVRYVTASVDMDTSTDEAVVIYIFGNPRFRHDGLCTDVVA